MVNEYGDTGQDALIFIVPLIGGFLAVLLVSGLNLFLPLAVAVWTSVALALFCISGFLWRRLDLTSKSLTRYAVSSGRLAPRQRLWPIRLAVPTGDEATWPHRAGARRLYLSHSHDTISLWRARPGRMVQIATTPATRVTRIRSFDLDPDGAGRGRRQGIRLDFADGTWRLLQLRRGQNANELARALRTPRAA